MVLLKRIIAADGCWNIFRIPACIPDSSDAVLLVVLQQPSRLLSGLCVSHFALLRSAAPPAVLPTHTTVAVEPQ
jgi:hypothetical protein